MLTQRPSKVPIHYRDKLNNLLKDLQKHNIIKQIGSSPHDKPVYGTTYLSPLIIIPKGDSNECVLDARHLNSNTEQSDESWPIEPLATQLARANKKYKPVHYLIKHEEVLPHQKHDSHPILADYGTDQFSLRINDKGNDIIIKPLNSFSFNAITPFQTKFEAPVKKHNKSLHQQSLLLNDTDVTSDDEDHIFTLIPKDNSSFSPIETLHEQESFSTITKPKPTIKPKSSSQNTSAIDVQPNSTSMTHSSQLVPFYDPSFFKYKCILKVSSSLTITHCSLKHFKYNNLKTQFSELYILGYLVMKSLNFSLPLLLAISFCTHITKHLNNFSSIPLLTS